MFITSYFSHKDGDQEEIPITLTQRRAFNIQRNEKTSSGIVAKSKEEEDEEEEGDPEEENQVGQRS